MTETTTRFRLLAEQSGLPQVPTVLGGTGKFSLSRTRTTVQAIAYERGRLLQLALSSIMIFFQLRRSLSLKVECIALLQIDSLIPKYFH